MVMAVVLRNIVCEYVSSRNSTKREARECGGESEYGVLCLLLLQLFHGIGLYLYKHAAIHYRRQNRVGED